MISERLNQPTEPMIEIVFDFVNDNLIIGQTEKVIYIDKNLIETFAYKLLIIKRELEISKNLE